MTKWKQSNSHPLILRPLVGNMRHELNLLNMKSVLDRLMHAHESELSYSKLDEKFINLATRNKKQTHSKSQLKSQFQSSI